MDVHQNARLTPRCRELLVARVLAGRCRRTVALELGVSEKTVQKWVGRFQREGITGLRDRSSRPRRSPAVTAEALQLAVVALRRQRFTLASIASQLLLSRSSVARICRRAGLSRLSQLEPVPHYPRYERAQPGELLHLDVKKLGRILRVGHRITGQRTETHRDAGWEYVHVAIDDCSRVAYCQVLPDEEGVSALRVPARRGGLLRRARGHDPRSPDRQRSLLPRQELRGDLLGPRAEASSHATLHAAHEWQSRAVHPECAARMGLRPCLRHLRAAHQCVAAMVTRLQLASTSRELGRAAANLQTQPRQE